ncbi:Chromo domain/shadow [Plasmopara halstedii]|uniref:Chromo domain/shadow n=1 Tax=Plasmopara halstedii TaxID=4781 RepID=A0A0P1ATX4_PLAHL|nr:Chromo domain/shadow [Plasmopara halstedii]CEG45670.1 Chromo domain/shadow [Plasmopara halstedii]|eukprot:XP_024582039.1 Chromo domain/shadow [Plasmopara halstedii]
MTDTPVRSKQMELFGKLHMSMDHVLAKLLLEAPPLPDALKLQTEKQSFATTWVQVSEAFEKRKTMLQRRKEKSKIKKKRRLEDTTAQDKEKGKENEKDMTTRQANNESRNSDVSPPNLKSIRGLKAIKKASKKNSSSPKINFDTAEPSASEQNVLEKLRELPMCQDLKFGSNKYRAIVKWIEIDNGNDTGLSTDLRELLKKLQIDVALKSARTTLKESRKRSVESLDNTPHTDKRSKVKSLESERRQDKKVRDVVDGAGKKEKPKSKGWAPDSDEKRNFQEQEEKKKKREEEKSIPRQKKKAEGKKNENAVKTGKDTSQPNSKKHSAIVVTKVNANEAIYGNADANSLLHKKKTVQSNASGTSTNVKLAASEKMKPGSSPTSAIVLDDSEEESEAETKEQDSSTDDDQDLFDLNEEDVYVVEAILCVKEGRSLMSAGRRQKEADLYLVKWDGYNELTWEPDENIPRRLIEIFRERERAKRACQFQVKKAHERREVLNVTTQQPDVIYMIQWINQELPVWESRTTLPIKTQVWLDRILGAPVSKKRRETKVVKQ